MAKSKNEPMEAEVAPRPVREIINALMMELQAHPDVSLGNCDIHGPCPANLMLPGAPKSAQHFTQLRIAYRDPMETPESRAKKPWKWAKVIESLNAPTPMPPDNPRPEHEHLYAKPEPKQEPVNA